MTNCDQATAPLAEVLVMQVETLGGAPPLPQDHLIRGGNYIFFFTIKLVFPFPQLDPKTSKISGQRRPLRD